MGNLHGVRGPARRELILPAAVYAVGLSLLFLIVYGSINSLTAQRSDVGTWRFAWESAIPFVPLLILPYMSIDLFFFAAPFVCRERGEIRTLGRRIVFVILTAGAFFLILPLQLAFERPQVGGWLGSLFDAFREMDRPYNLFPSLHIALRTILAAVYARYTLGLWNALSHVWFSLIGFSTVLTYQHHVVDVAGGFVLAAFAFYLFRESAPRLPVVPNRRIGVYYAVAAAALVLVAVTVWPWGAFLLWFVAATVIVAMAYFGLGPGIFRKTDGRLPFSTRFVLAPILLGQYLSLLYYRWQCRAWDEVTPNLWIGRVLGNAEAADAVRQGVTAVLDLTGEFPEATPFLAVTYHNVPILDLTAPAQDQLDEAVSFIAAHQAQGIVYVHCKIGYSRSAAVVCAYLLASGAAATTEDAINRLRRVRPSSIIRPEAMEALQAFEPRQKEAGKVCTAGS